MYQWLVHYFIYSVLEHLCFLYTSVWYHIITFFSHCKCQLCATFLPPFVPTLCQLILIFINFIIILVVFLNFFSFYKFIPMNFHPLTSLFFWTFLKFFLYIFLVKIRFLGFKRYFAINLSFCKNFICLNILLSFQIHILSIIVFCIFVVMIQYQFYVIQTAEIYHFYKRHCQSCYIDIQFDISIFTNPMSLH